MREREKKNIIFCYAINKFVGTHPRMNWCHIERARAHTHRHKQTQKTNAEINDVDGDGGGGGGYKVKKKKLAIFEIQWQTNYEL